MVLSGRYLLSISFGCLGDLKVKVQGILWEKKKRM